MDPAVMKFLEENGFATDESIIKEIREIDFSSAEPNEVRAEYIYHAGYGENFLHKSLEKRKNLFVLFQHNQNQIYYVCRIRMANRTLTISFSPKEADPLFFFNSFLNNIKEIIRFLEIVKITREESNSALRGPLSKTK